MSEKMAIMPFADYEAACNSVRAKTGKSDLIKSGDLATEIDSIEVGGGGSGDELAKALIARNTTDVVVPEGTVQIGGNAFSKHSKLKTITLPDSITRINTRAFDSCSKLTDVNISDNCICNNIGTYAFYNCTSLNSIVIPKGVTSIGDAAFMLDSKLATVTFKGTPTSTIPTTVFSNCNALADIYVPWAEGAVANAPWGAKNAQIHYNSEV